MFTVPLLYDNNIDCEAEPLYYLRQFVASSAFLSDISYIATPLSYNGRE